MATSPTKTKCPGKTAIGYQIKASKLSLPYNMKIFSA